MSENVLESICQLESIDIAQTELHMCVHYQLCETQDFSTQVEGISES